MGCCSTRDVDPDTAAEPPTRTIQHMRLFVAVVILRVLRKLSLLHQGTHESWVTFTEQLINRILEGMNIQEDFHIDLSKANEVAGLVISSLKGQYGLSLKYMLLVQDPSVHTAFIRSMQCHVTHFSMLSLRPSCSRFSCWLSRALNCGSCRCTDRISPPVPAGKAKSKTK